VAHRKSGKNFLGLRKKIKKLFVKIFTRNSHKQELFTPLKNPDKLPQNPKFSDVIAIEGHHGHLQAVSLKNQPEICVKTRCP